MFKDFWKNVLKSLEKDEDVFKKRQDKYKKGQEESNVPLDLFLNCSLELNAQSVQKFYV